MKPVERVGWILVGSCCLAVLLVFTVRLFSGHIDMFCGVGGCETILDLWAFALLLAPAMLGMIILALDPILRPLWRFAERLFRPLRRLGEHAGLWIEVFVIGTLFWSAPISARLSDEFAPNITLQRTRLKLVPAMRACVRRRAAELGR